MGSRVSSGSVDVHDVPEYSAAAGSQLEASRTGLGRDSSELARHSMAGKIRQQRSFNLVEDDLKQRHVVADGGLLHGLNGEHVNPYTEDLVVCTRQEIPLETFRTFPFMRKNRLIDEFYFKTEDGSVVFGEEKTFLEKAEHRIHTIKENVSSMQHNIKENVTSMQHIVSEKLAGAESMKSADIADYMLLDPVSTESKPSFETEDDRHNRHLYEEKQKYRYVRLVTTNWWYESLLFTLCLASLIVSGKTSNFLFCIGLITMGGNSIGKWSRRGIGGFVLLLELISYGIFYRDSEHDYRDKSEVKRSGDIIVDESMSRAERNIPFWAMVMFNILEVDEMVRDIVKWMHPFKDQQPYGAFKADGHRCYLLGFRDKHSYRATSKPIPYNALLVQIGIESMLFLLKTYSAAVTNNWTFFVMALPGVAITYLKTMDIFSSLRHREVYWQNIRLAYHYGDDRERRSCDKSKLRHFPNLNWNQEELTERGSVCLKLGFIYGAIVCVSVWLCWAHLVSIADSIHTAVKDHISDMKDNS